MKYRKKPVVIEARQLSHENHQDVSNWVASAGYKVRHASKPPMRAVTGIIIETLEGDMTAEYGDWIIKGVAGEFYPCKPEIFAESYEAVTAAIEQEVTTHKGLPVKGYTDQSDYKVERVNQNKVLEETVLRAVDAVGHDRDLDADMRWLSIARTHFEQGFMALNRAIFKPQRIKLSEDEQGGCRGANTRSEGEGSHQEVSQRAGRVLLFSDRRPVLGTWRTRHHLLRTRNVCRDRGQGAG